MDFGIVHLFQRANARTCVSFYASTLYLGTKHRFGSIFEMLPPHYRSPLHLGAIGLMSVASVTAALADPPVVPFEWQNTKHL